MDQNVIVAAAIGFFIGAVLVWIIKNTNQSNAENLQEASDTLRKEHEALKKAFADYRNNVNHHFIRTADAVDQLTDSYKNVYNHLSVGARALMNEETLQKQIEKRQGKTVTLGYLGQPQEESTPAPKTEAAPARKTDAESTPAPKTEAAPARKADAESTPAPKAKTAPARKTDAENTQQAAAQPEPPKAAAQTPPAENKNETPQEAVKRHLQNNQGKQP